MTSYGPALIPENSLDKMTTNDLFLVEKVFEEMTSPRRSPASQSNELTFSSYPSYSSSPRVGQAMIRLPGPEAVQTLHPLSKPKIITLVENRGGILTNLTSDTLINMITKGIDAPDRNNFPPFRVFMVSDTKGGAQGQRYKVEVLREIIKKFGAKPEGKKENLSHQIKKLWYDGEGQIGSKVRELLDARRFDLISLAEFNDSNPRYVEKLWKDSGERPLDFIDLLKQQENATRAGTGFNRKVDHYVTGEITQIR